MPPALHNGPHDPASSAIMFVAKHHQRIQEPKLNNDGLNRQVIDTESEADSRLAVRNAVPRSLNKSSNVRAFHRLGRGLGLLFVVALLIVVGRECKKLLGTSNGYGSLYNGLGLRRLASGGDEGRSDGAGRGSSSSDEELQEVCSMITGTSTGRQQPEGSRPTETTHAGPTQGGVEHTEGSNPLPGEMGSPTPPLERPSVLRLKIPGATTHVTPRLSVTPYSRRQRETPEQRASSAGLSELLSLLQTVRSGGAAGSGTTTGARRPWTSHAAPRPPSPIVISSEDEEEMDSGDPSWDELRPFLEPLPPLLSPLSSDDGDSGTPRTPESAQVQAVVRQRSSPSSSGGSDPLEGPSRGPPRPPPGRSRRQRGFGSWHPRSLGNTPVLTESVRSTTFETWHLTPKDFGKRNHPGANKRMCNAMFYLLSCPALELTQVLDLERLTRGVLSTFSPLGSGKYPTIRGSVAAVRYGHTVYALDCIFRVTELVPSMNAGQWWGTMFRLLRLDQDNYSPQIDPYYIDYLRRCRAAIDLYAAGQRPPEDHIRYILEFFQNELSTGKEPQEFSEGSRGQRDDSHADTSGEE